jgi:hypothetical protein
VVGDRAAAAEAATERENQATTSARSSVSLAMIFSVLQKHHLRGLEPVVGGCLSWLPVIEWPNGRDRLATSRSWGVAAFVTYAVLVQQSFDTAQADTEPLGYLPSGGARPVEIDHGLKIFRREAITQAPGADHALPDRLCTRAALVAASRQDHCHFADLFEQVKAVRIAS